MARRYPYYRQLDQMDCGPTCLRMVAQYYGRHYTAQTLRDRSEISRDGVSMLGIAEAAEAIGFRSIGIKVTIEKLINETPLPCILHWQQNHFVVLNAIETRKSAVSKRFLAGIWGGRKAQIDLDSFLLKTQTTDNAVRNDFKEFQYNVNDKVRAEVFHISDPAKGVFAYTHEEFEKFWLASGNDGKREGLALLLEVTPRFYEEEGEAARPLQFSQLLAFLGQYKKLIIQLCLGLLVGSGLSLLFPFLTQSVVDVGINTQNVAFIYLVLIGQMVLMCSTAAVDFLRSWILLHISTRLNLTILSDFLAKLMRLPVSFFDVKQFGDIMQRIGDHHRIEAFLTGQTLNFFFSLFNLIIFGFLLAYYHVFIFAVALGGSGLYTIWVILFLKQRRNLDSKRFTVSSHNQSQIVQLINGMQDIKMSGAETSKRWEWERTQAKLFKWNVKSLSLTQFQQAGGLLINQSKNIFITFLAAKAVVDGQLTLGGMMSVQYILGQFNAPIEQMVSFLRSWQDAQMSLERLNEIHSLTDEEPIGESRRKEWDKRQDILLKDITYTYPGAGNEPVLKNINLTIKYGKTTAIVGTSGSGKTTLLKLIMRFYEPQSGTISLVKNHQILERETSMDNPAFEMGMESNLNDTLSFNSDQLGLKHISHKAWRQQCGVVMQDSFIFSDTIARNIAVSDQLIDQDRLYRAARVANIDKFIESLPLGYYTKIGAEGNGISQGQKQRILIARSVYKNPQLLLFDEATNSLDANNEAAIIHNLVEFFEGRTVVVVAHRLSTVKHADCIVVMEKGNIVESGTHTKLISLKGKYYELVSNQLELAKG